MGRHHFSRAFGLANARIYTEQIAPSLRAGQTLLFAHGFAIYYRTIIPRKDVDVLMVAPKGLGPMVRREFLRGRGASGLIAVHQNPSRHAKQTALAWAKGSEARAQTCWRRLFGTRRRLIFLVSRRCSAATQAPSFVLVSTHSLAPVIHLSSRTSNVRTNSSLSLTSFTKRDFERCVN